MAGTGSHRRRDLRRRQGGLMAICPSVQQPGSQPPAPPVFGCSFVWAVERGDLGVERVVRYRLTQPAS